MVNGYNGEAYSPLLLDGEAMISRSVTNSYLIQYIFSRIGRTLGSYLVNISKKRVLSEMVNAWKRNYYIFTHLQISFVSLVKNCNHKEVRKEDQKIADPWV